MAVDLADVTETACPACGKKNLTVEWRMTAKPVGSFSLSGMQMKFAATNVPVAVCSSCGFEKQGHLG